MKSGAKIGIAVGAAAVVVAAAIGVGFAVLGPRSPAPSDAVDAYFDALEAGDAEAALALTASDPDQRAALAGAYDGVTAQVESHEIVASSDETVDADGPGASASVDVTYVLDGAEHDATIELQNDDGWVIVGDATITATTSLGDTVAVGALSVPAGTAQPLLPGVYSVRASPATLLTGETSVTVLIGTDTAAEITASLGPDAAPTAQTQIDAYLAQCTVPAPTLPAACGIRVPWGADLATVTGFAYRIESAPVVAIADDVRTFAATGGVLVVTATGQTRDGAAASLTYRDDAWALRGAVTFTGTEMVLSAW